MKKGILFLIIASCCYGVPQTLAKLTLDLGYNTQTLLIFVCTFGSIVSFLGTRVKKVSLKLTRKQFLHVSTVGAVFFAITTTLVTAACNYISPGAVIMLHFIYPIAVMLIMTVVFKERATKFKMLAIPCAIIGVACFSDFSGGTGNAFIGVLLALISGFTYAVYVIANDKTTIKDIDGFVLSFYIYFLWGIAMLLFTAVTGSFTWNPVPESFLYLFGYAVFMLGGVYFIAAGIRITGATTGALINMGEPMAGMIVSTIVFRDPITALTVVGCILILSSVFITAWADRMKEKQELARQSQNE